MEAGHGYKISGISVPFRKRTNPGGPAAGEGGGGGKMLVGILNYTPKRDQSGRGPTFF